MSDATFPDSRPRGEPHRPRIGVDFHAFEGIYQGSRSRLLAIFSHAFDVAHDFDFVFFTRDPDGLRAALPRANPERVFFEALRSKGPVGRLLVELPRLAKRCDLDLFHSQYILPAGLACRRVVTVHDILFESHPSFFPRTFVRRSRILTRRSARVADHVMTVSEFSARELRERYGIDPSRITVSHNAVDDARFHPQALDEGVLRARGLEPNGYLLSVGRVDARKNLGGLIEAYSGVDTSLPLVIVGQVVCAKTARVLAWRDPEGRRRVIHLSDVRDDELASLYAGATLFAFVSHAEGFGMPPLEAMASGTAVLTSNRTAMPEVAGDAARLVDPESVADIRTGLSELLTDGAARETLIRRGLERARSFSWRNEAETLLRTYGRVLERPVAR